jgi:hypothetical protein
MKRTVETRILRRPAIETTRLSNKCKEDLVIIISMSTLLIYYISKII